MSVVGSVALLVFLGLFGLKILIAFSVFIDKLRGTSPKVQEQVILLPPEFDSLPEATNSAVTWVTGRAQPKTTVLLYVNDNEPQKVTVADDGVFRIEKVSLHEGVNTMRAKTTDEKNAASEFSDTLKITYKKAKPTLSLTNPDDGKTVSDDKGIVTFDGKTEEGNSVTIGDRFVPVRGDGSFSYDMTLKEGEQTIKIIARDIAGNETTMERKITCKKP